MAGRAGPGRPSDYSSTPLYPHPGTHPVLPTLTKSAGDRVWEFFLATVNSDYGTGEVAVRLVKPELRGGTVFKESNHQEIKRRVAWLGIRICFPFNFSPIRKADYPPWTMVLPEPHPSYLSVSHAPLSRPPLQLYPSCPLRGPVGSNSAKNIKIPRYR